MNEKKRLMKVRKQISKKRPNFKQFESWRYVRIKDHWRRPRGIDNKMRFNLSGWPKSVNIGWRGPKAVRGLHPSGLKEVMVWNIADLEKIDPETQAIRIGGTVGKRKKTPIIEEANRLKIKVLNPGIPEVSELDEMEEEEG
jgi:large subunit ribosomal protein L32e